MISLRRSPQPTGPDREGDVAAPELPWLENGPSARWWPRVNFSELWLYRELVFFLAQRDVKLRYRQTFFGVAWAILQPLAAVAIFSVVFGRLAAVPSDGLPYPVFVLAGLVAWTYVSSAVEQAAQSLTVQRRAHHQGLLPAPAGSGGGGATGAAGPRHIAGHPRSSWRPTA